MSTKLENWLLALVLVVAGGLRWVVVEQYEAAHPLADRPVIDERSYDAWAREIAGGEWLGHEIFFQEPLYPYALAVLYAAVDGSPTVEREWARRVHVGLGVLTVFLVARLARRLFGPGAGLVAATFVALHGPALWFPVLLLKENLFLPLAAGFAWLLSFAAESNARRAAWFAVGALGALGALLRGNMLVLLPWFTLTPFVVGWFGERAWRRAAVASTCTVLGVACVLSPVAWRNQVVGGRFVLTTSGAGTNFYGGNNLDNPYGVAKEFDFVRGVPKYEAADWRHEAERRTGRTLDPAETSSFWLGESLRSMQAEPFFHLRALWRKFRLALGEYEVPDNHFYDWDRAFVPLLAAPWPGFALSGTLGLAGMLAIAGLRRRANPWPALAFFVLYLGTIVLTVMSERARLVLLPLVATFAAGWIVHVCSRGAPRRTGAFVGLVFAVPLVCIPVYDAGQRQRDLDERDYNLATVVLADGGDLLRVRTIAGALERRYPGTPRPTLLAADVDYRLARRVLDDPRAAPMDVARARGELERIVAALDACEPRANPQERFGVTKLRGAIRQYRGEFAAAERDFRVAAEFDPEDFEVLRRLAVSLANRAMQETEPAAKRSALAEAVLLFDRLVARAPDDAELVRLAREVRAQL
ncbi:MAG: glycosyltransferase family 39 protein [Planctomycetes bacterium]|nr:glycosyltransferase family 39 protein [Planctomycetota bacterium]